VAIDTKNPVVVKNRVAESFLLGFNHSLLYGEEGNFLVRQISSNLLAADTRRFVTHSATAGEKIPRNTSEYYLKLPSMVTPQDPYPSRLHWPSDGLG
jgi:hypothetical protein